MGDVTTDIRSVYRGKGLIGEMTQEGGFLAPIYERETTAGHLRRSLKGG